MSCNFSHVSAGLLHHAVWGTLNYRKERITTQCYPDSHASYFCSVRNATVHIEEQWGTRLRGLTQTMAIDPSATTIWFC